MAGFQVITYGRFWVFTEVTGLLPPQGPRQVALIEGATLLPRTTFFSEIVPDPIDERSAWFSALLERSSMADLVFLDPDNGIEVASKPVGRKGSSKYVRWSEIDQLFESGCSLVVYQHYPRKPREEFAASLAETARRRTGAVLVGGFHSAHVLFLLLGQPHHEERLRAGIRRVVREWAGQLNRLELSAAAK
ncbi:MAG: hypothetical protein GY937_09255 [bacterium]|nr:hypothetical protein [bacterium]